MMKTMRYILLWMVLANSMVLFARTDAKDDSGAIDRKRMAAFKEYVVNCIQRICRELHAFAKSAFICGKKFI